MPCWPRELAPVGLGYRPHCQGTPSLKSLLQSPPLPRLPLAPRLQCLLCRGVKIDIHSYFGLQFASKPNRPAGHPRPASPSAHLATDPPYHRTQPVTPCPELLSPDLPLPPPGTAARRGTAHARLARRRSTPAGRGSPLPAPVLRRGVAPSAAPRRRLAPPGRPPPPDPSSLHGSTRAAHQCRCTDCRGAVPPGARPPSAPPRLPPPHQDCLLPPAGRPPPRLRESQSASGGERSVGGAEGEALAGGREEAVAAPPRQARRAGQGRGARRPGQQVAGQPRGPRGQGLRGGRPAAAGQRAAGPGRHRARHSAAASSI
nr:formin-like protein 5 [Setaria viridis]